MFNDLWIDFRKPYTVSFDFILSAFHWPGQCDGFLGIVKSNVRCCDHLIRSLYKYILCTNEMGYQWTFFLDIEFDLTPQLTFTHVATWYSPVDM